MNGVGVTVQVDLEERLLREGKARKWLRHLVRRNEGSEAELPVAGRIAPLLNQDFVDYLEQLFRNRWSATEQIIKQVQVLNGRGFRLRPHGRRWVLELSFEGPEWQMETTAEVASHWAAVWLSAALPIISQRDLQPAGITAHAHTITVEPLRPCFVPVGPFGYARFVPELLFRMPERAVVLDQRITENVPGLSSVLLPYARKLHHNACLCQMCAPQHDASAVVELLAEKGLLAA